MSASASGMQGLGPRGAEGRYSSPSRGASPRSRLALGSSSTVMSYEMVGTDLSVKSGLSDVEPYVPRKRSSPRRDEVELWTQTVNELRGEDYADMANEYETGNDGRARSLF